MSSSSTTRSAASPCWRHFWGIALAWEYSLPTRFRRFHGEIPVSTSHVPERFALFTIIVLGETIVAAAGLTDLDPAGLVVALVPSELEEDLSRERSSEDREHRDDAELGAERAEPDRQ